MRAKLGLMVVTLLLLLGGLQTTAYAQGHGGGGGHAGGGGGRAGGGAWHGGGGHAGGGAWHGGGGAWHGGFHGGGSRVIISPGFGFGYGGYGPYYGWGSPWGWGSSWYGGYYPEVEVRNINYGTIEFKVKPENTQVYIDQKLVGTVDDLDHHKAYLPGGYHDIRLVSPSGQTFDRSVYVAIGEKIKIDRKM